MGNLNFKGGVDESPEDVQIAVNNFLKENFPNCKTAEDFENLFNDSKKVYIDTSLNSENEDEGDFIPVTDLLDEGYLKSLFISYLFNFDDEEIKIDEKSLSLCIDTLKLEEEIKSQLGIAEVGDKALGSNLEPRNVKKLEAYLLLKERTKEKIKNVDRKL